jgi:hypothetical protein
MRIERVRSWLATTHKAVLIAKRIWMLGLKTCGAIK